MSKKLGHLAAQLAPPAAEAPTPTAKPAPRPPAPPAQGDPLAPNKAPTWEATAPSGQPFTWTGRYSPK
jgi:hypothetical protein